MRDWAGSEKRFVSAQVKDAQKAGEASPLRDGEIHEQIMRRKGKDGEYEDTLELLQLFAIFRKLNLPMKRVTKNQIKHFW